MRYNNTILTLIALLATIWSSLAQSLPAQLHFSDDGYRLIRGDIKPTGFYDRETIDTVFINFKESNYWSLLTANKDSSIDLLSTLTYKGITYDSVGVRFKGLTSYSMVNGQKKSFNITLDAVKKDQNIEGYSTFNLNNSAEDASFMHEFMYNYFQSKNVPCARTNYKILMINNVSWGIYVNVQQLDKQHAREWFSDADATRWRALSPTWSMNDEGNIGGGGFPMDSLPPGGGGGFPMDSLRPGGGGFPMDSLPPGGGGGFGGGGGDDPGGGFGAGKSSLNFLGLDTSLYIANYTLKHTYKEKPWEDLVEACRVLNTVSKDSIIDSLSKVFDIDGALWFLAYEILFTDDDSYVNKGGMDYYVYFDEGTNRIIPIEFDGNTSFVTQNAKLWNPFFKEDNASFPLCNVLLRVPELRQRYLAHVRTILEQSFNKASSDSIVDYYAEKIDKYVNADKKKIFTYSQFKTEVSAIKTFMSNRKAYYLANTEVNVKSATISSVIYKAGTEEFSPPDSTQEVKVTCTITAEAGIANVYLYHDKGIEGNFTKTEMFDDGLHNDGQAGDKVYGGSLPAHEKGKYMRFYIESVSADAANTRTYSPAGAEHDVYIYRVKIAESENSDVVINEIMLSNSTVVADLNGEYDDWIELYNNSSLPIDLSGYYLTDDKDKLTKYQIPGGTIIGANDYLIVWCDDDSLQTGFHANFKLSTKGETVFLVTPKGTIADEITCSSQNVELSFSRVPNGRGPCIWQQPTFKSENTIYNIAVKQTVSAINTFSVYPNPANQNINVVFKNNDQSNELKVYSSYGSLFYQVEFKNNCGIDVSNWTPGVYLISINNAITKRIMVAE